MENLTRMDKFYTLQGKAAEIQIKSVSSVLKKMSYILNVTVTSS